MNFGDASAEEEFKKTKERIIRRESNAMEREDAKKRKFGFLSILSGIFGQRLKSADSKVYFVFGKG